MGPLGLSRAGLWLSRAMSRCVLEPRLAGKRWLVGSLPPSGVNCGPSSWEPRVRTTFLGGSVVTRATVSLGQAELFGLTAEEVYLVHDELDKPLGKVALKLGGSARGHNGVRSCMSCLNSSAMPRLRVGIGRPTHQDAVQAYVLGRFSPAEQELLPPVLERAADLLLDHIRQRSQESSSGP
ncbi:probable peptidyl-tRNA hydrolase isoform X4 [Cervus elaphus]|uniref:probable peptidyl-tRNA hydrolase isoform X4 n=1 Tax=Cervus canadensis TaxID=1574408 RepID=UPI001C9E7310|nr:probable peptidyl-tRNA hydrolase isoform X4 [Cervus canadensis]XP_043772748.1 probable peptidyl-tRNA hydrolase isoform X4 [Cervus elaphus]